MPGLPSTTVLQATDPSALLGLPGPVRAPVAFALVLLLGWVISRRYDGVVDRSIAASIDRPVSSMVYGIAAHAAIAFFGVYAASQLGQVAVAGRPLGAVGLLIGLVVLAAAAGLGFTVVGCAAVELWAGDGRWHGLLAGASIAGVAALVDPLVGGVVWLVVVSTGIGGPVRAWLHASEDVEAAR